jgi:hypothetical protein
MLEVQRKLEPLYLKKNISKKPVPLVFFLWDMMCEKHLYFFDGQDVAFYGVRPPLGGFVIYA